MAIKDHLEKLNYFYQVAKVGSIKEATSILNITQPSITKSIHLLEDAMDCKLFVRSSRGVARTREGDLLFSYCHKLFSDLDDLEARLGSVGDPMAGQIRVGTYDSIAIYFWPKFLRNFLPKYPNLHIELTTNRSLTIQKMVEADELDLGLIVNPRESSRLGVIDLSTDSFQLYQSAKMKSCHQGNLTVPLIYMPDALAGENKSRLEQYVGSQGGGSLTRHYKTSSLESAKELIINGIGVGLLPRMVAKDAVNNKVIEPMRQQTEADVGFGEHRIGLVYAKHKNESKIMQAIIAQVKQHDW